MLLKTRPLLLAATLIAVPMAASIAQQNNPAGNLGSNKSVTATPSTTQDSKSNPGMNTGDAGSHATATGNYSGTAMSRSVPGATGHSVVPGTTSSQASASSGTAAEKTGSQAAGNK